MAECLLANAFAIAAVRLPCCSNDVLCNTCMSCVYTQVLVR